MSNNPYNNPESDLTTSNNQSNYPKKTDAINGLHWFLEAIQYFTRVPGVWLGGIVIIGFIMLILSPLINLLVNILNPVFIGGFMYGCQQIKQNKVFKIEDLFAGFKQKFTPLAIVGLIYVTSMVCIIIITFFIMGAIGFNTVGIEQMNDPQALQAMKPEEVISLFALPLLIAFALMIPVLMAYWFAPALIMLKNMQPIDAMKQSFQACRINFVPFLIYGLTVVFAGFMLIAIIGMIATISWGLAILLSILGYLVMISVLIASTYTAYMDIFPDEMTNDDTNESLTDSSNMVA